MSLIRWPIGRLILLLNFIFSPRSPKRTKSKQKEIDTKTQSLSLYQLPACPFCVKVRRAMKREGLKIELRNINQGDDFREELIREGGKKTVPCLRIEKEDGEVQWLYESSDVVAHLQQLVRVV
ncbi:MAG: glutaredoxin [Litorilituus sp.]|nr:glutaredoxin [Litorilituus sp.]